MIVVTLTDCPQKLRGDLTKWLMEINTNVYVGHLSARVRDQLWERICEHIKHGQATMVFSTSGEQKLGFYVHNTTWEIVDYDGLKLMRRPKPKKRSYEKEEPFVNDLEQGFSKAAKIAKSNRIQLAKQRDALARKESYTVIDVETTGTQLLRDVIIELGALKVVDNRIVDQFEMLLAVDREIPPTIEDLTGISTALIKQDGRPVDQALKAFLAFIDGETLVCHHAAFDMKFLQKACRDHHLTLPRKNPIDTYVLAKRKLRQLPDYKLTTVAAYFNLDTTGAHRALKDCELTHGILKKLNELDHSAQ